MNVLRLPHSYHVVLRREKAVTGNSGETKDVMIIIRPQAAKTKHGASDLCRVRSYLSTTHKQGHPLLYALERALAGKPLTFNQAAVAR